MRWWAQQESRFQLVLVPIGYTLLYTFHLHIFKNSCVPEHALSPDAFDWYVSEYTVSRKLFFSILPGASE